MSSWGEAAVGRVRPSMDRPTYSAVLGLVGACLGVDRSDEHVWAAMAEGYRFAMLVRSAGEPVKDFHTIESIPQAALRQRPVRTRRDELAAVAEYVSGGGNYRSMIPTTRDYRVGGSYLVALAGEAPFPLERIHAAMRAPVFVPYLGRKSCPLSAPLAPEIVEAPFLREAMPPGPLYWQDGIEAGVEPELTFERNDALLSRSRWEYGRRLEHFARLAVS